MTKSYRNACSWTLALLVYCLVAPADAQSDSRVDGLWQGPAVMIPGQMEFTVILDVGLKDGRWVGTLDMPQFGLEYLPMLNLTVEGDRIRFDCDRVVNQPDPNNHLYFEATASEDGKALSGRIWGRADGQDVEIPFSTTRLADAFSPREKAAAPTASLTTLSAQDQELREAFNRDQGTVRVVTLLSPTCGGCLAAADLIRQHVLEKVDSPELRFYVVWGPMLGDETVDAARKATATLPDPRALHFWTSEEGVAQRFAEVIGLSGSERAWDTFQVFAQGRTWSDHIPAPDRYMHLHKPLPQELTFDGPKLADWVRELLAGSPSAK